MVDIFASKGGDGNIEYLARRVSAMLAGSINAGDIVSEAHGFLADNEIKFVRKYGAGMLIALVATIRRECLFGSRQSAVGFGKLGAGFNAAGRLVLPTT